MAIGTSITRDPDVTIDYRGTLYGVPVVVYRNASERWYIVGACNGCGVCDGAHAHAGPPEGRLDIPVRPEGPASWPGCVLSGRYL